MNRYSPISTRLSVERLYSLFLGFTTKVSPDVIKLSLSHSVSEDCYRWTKSEGKHGLKRFKDVSSFVIRTLMGIRGIKTEFKVPRKYWQIIRLASTSTLVTVYWISILSVHRLVRLPIDYSVETITSPFSGSIKNSRFTISILKSELKKTCKIFKESFSISPFSSSFRWAVSGSGGPNGAPAYKKTREDLVAINKMGFDAIIKDAFFAFSYTNEDDYSYFFTDLKRYSSVSIEEGELFHSKLAFLQDKGGKTRVVALFDSLSQSILKTVHDRVNAILRLIPMDGTFDQDAQRVRVKNMSKNGKFLSSIDLTACTDRFPAFFQFLVLVFTGFLTLKQGLSWLALIKGRSFFFKNGKGERFNVKYSVGQPMGAYSSWPVMAMSHHVLVQLSYRHSRGFNLESNQLFTDYSILGDDLVIADELVSKSYKELIAILGIDYSPSKSFEGNGIAEFAKSLFRFGEDLTPFSLSLFSVEEKDLVSNIMAIMNEIGKRKLTIIDLYVITSLFPRSRNLVRLAILSPKSNRSILPYVYRVVEDDDITFSVLQLSSKVNYYANYDNWFNMTTALAMWSTKMRWKYSNNRTRLGGSTDPLYVLNQVGRDNMDSYPLKELDFTLAKSKYQVIVGYGWFCYDPLAWPDGLKDIGLFESLIPGPSYADKELIELKFNISMMRKMDRLIPGYFEKRCVKHIYKLT